MKWCSIIFIIKDIQIKAIVEEWISPIMLAKMKIFDNIKYAHSPTVGKNVLVQLFRRSVWK